MIADLYVTSEAGNNSNGDNRFMKTISGIFRVLPIVLCLLLATHAWATSYTLTVVTQGGGTITTNPTLAAYPANSTVTLTATPSDGWYFADWSGAAGGTTNSVNVFMSGNLTVTGTFLAYPQYSFPVATNGQGSIVLNPPGASFYSNTVVMLTATPASGWVFTGWSGATNSVADPLTWAVDASAALTGNFAELPAFTVQPQNITNSAGSTVSFAPTVVGTGPLAYQWYYNGNPLSDDTGATLTLTNVTTGEAGFYDLVATNNYGSVTSSVVALVVTSSGGSTNVVSVCNEAALQAAIAVGGWISIGCSSTILLTNTLTITNKVILDGSGVSAVIDGGNAVRLFYVMPGASLAVTNLTLANGLLLVTNGSSPADGGCIYNNGGAVTLTACTLTNNDAIAAVNTGLARGGAIFNNGGVVQLYGSMLLNNLAYGEDYSNYTIIASSFGGGNGFGGALYNTNGTALISGCLLQSNLCIAGAGVGNVSCQGGAVFEASGFVTITNSLLISNQADGAASGGGDVSGLPNPVAACGGALAAAGGGTTLNLCQFAGNKALGGDAGFHSQAAPGSGGAVYCSNSLAAVSCSFSGNLTSAGNNNYDAIYPAIPTANGGAICNQGTMTLRDCGVYSNYAAGAYTGTHSDGATGGNALGGGICNLSQLNLTNCTICLNAAVAGQGEQGEQVLGTSVAYNGEAIGGGVFNGSNGVFSALNVTIASNICNVIATNAAAGPYVYSNGIALGSQICNATNGTLSLRNSLLDDGTTNGIAYGVITDLGDNICSDGSANFTSGTSFNFTDPLLEPLADNGGPTLTMALQPDSPAIAYADSDTAPPDDQRGYARPTGTGVIDLGAYQSGATQIYNPPSAITLGAVTAGSNVIVSFTLSTALTNTVHLQTSTNLTVWTDYATYATVSGTTNVSVPFSKQSAARQFFRLWW